MTSVDERIVKMQFDNDEFKKRAAETKTSLSDLNKATESAGKSKGLLSMASGMTTVAATASKMAIVTTTAIATIANKAVNAGLQLASSLTLDPIKAGFSEYESLLSKQNTIMNATGKSAGAVKKVLNDLNHYSDKTIFSFSDMTEGLTTFVNAGIPLKQSAKAMKGIANASALAGASTQEAQSSFRAFGQALGQGFLGLQDFRQASVTGKIGTVGFKQSLIDAAVEMGTLTKKGDEYVTKSGKSLTATKNFDLSLQEQWASAQVLNKALGTYADQNTKLGKKAFKSAQDVRTFSAFMDTLKESLGSGWAQIFTTLIGGLGTSTKFFTGLSNTVGKQVNAFFNFANAAIVGFKALGGFNVVLQGLKNIISPFVAIFHAVGDALAIAFPGKGPGSGEVLFSMAKGFLALTQPLAWLATQIPKIVPFLVVFFKLIKLGITDIKAAAHYIGDLASSFADMLNIKAPSGAGFSGFFDSIINGVKKIASLGGDIIGQLFHGMLQAAGNIDFGTVGILAGAGILGGIYLQFKKFGKSGGGIFSSLKGTLGTVSETFDTLTGSLKALQTNIQSKTIMNIAIAVALVAASLVALSLIPADKMNQAVAGIAAAFGALLGAMKILTVISKEAGFVKLPLIGAGMVLMAGALALLTGAIYLMSLIPEDKIKKGLLGIAGALVVIAAGMHLMPANLPITAAGLTLVGFALAELAGAIALMGSMEWSTIGKGLAATAGALVVIAGAMQLMPPTLPITAAGLVLVGLALNGIAAALKIMATMSWEEIGKGLTTLGGALALLAIGLNAMSGTLLGSAALAVAAVGIDILTPALIAMSKLSWKQIAKGMAALAGGLAILAVAMYAMSGAIVGAAALLIVAPAITLLAGALLLLSTLSWEELGIALVALAATLGLIAAAGILLAPAVPAILALGAALVVLGAGLVLAGAGIFLMATGLGLLVQLGGSGIAALATVIAQFIAAIPAIAVALAEALIKMIEIIGKNAPMIGKAVISLLDQIIKIVATELPKIAVLFGQILDTLLKLIVQSVPKIAAAGLKLIIGLLNAIAKKVPELVKSGTNLIVKLIEGISSMAGDLAVAAAKGILDFINALSDAVVLYEPLIIEAVLNLGVNIVKGMIEGIKSFAGKALDAIGNMAHDMVDKALDVFSIFSPSRVFRHIGEFVVKGLTLGIQENASSAVRAIASMVGGSIAVANEYISKFIQDLDQQALAAHAKADGLAAAAEKAAKAAEKTKSKKDDKAANHLQNQADAAQKKADALDARVQTAKDKQDRAEQFKDASLNDKAKMRSEDAQNQLDAAKAAEQKAASERIQANALIKQSKAAGVTPAQRKEFERQAAVLRARAIDDAKRANDLINAAKASAADALKYQKLAGAEAAKTFQDAFDADAKAAADQEAFDKLTSQEKAAQRRKQAEDLQKKAQDDLAAAKKLAYTDVEAANELAAQAMQEAEQARQFLTDAANFDSQVKTPVTGGGGGGVLGTVVNLDPTEDAALRMREYEDLYNVGVNAAAADKTVQFNQYNTSPEALPPSEIYRNTNALVTFAVDKLDEASSN
jgi:hypothetical protein